MIEMPFFDFLETLSPWWWVAFGIFLGAVEMATMSFFLIWPGLAALVMAILLWLIPTMPGEIQLAVFAAIAILLTLVGRSYLLKFGDGGGEESSLNRRAEQLVGRGAKVLEFADGEGSVEIDSIRWKAVWPDGSAATTGDSVSITRVSGMTLHVENR